MLLNFKAKQRVNIIKRERKQLHHPLHFRINCSDSQTRIVGSAAFRLSGDYQVNYFSYLVKFCNYCYVYS